MAPIDLELFKEHTRGRSMVEVLLRGHLWLENALIDLIEAEVRNAKPLNTERMSFANKVNLAESLGLLGSSDAKTLRKVNGIRNRLAHDLHGEPTIDDIAILEEGLSQRQRELSESLLDSNEFHDPPSDPDHVVRLSVAVLALLVEIEWHRQQHKYWKENRQAIEAYRLVVEASKKLGREPTTWDQWRATLNVPEAPSPYGVTAECEAPEPPSVPRESAIEI